MVVPEYLTDLKKRAFEKGWMLEQIPYGARLREYNGITVDGYGTGFWTLTRCNPYASDSDGAVVGGEIREALAAERVRAGRDRKASLRRGERKSRQLKRA